MLHKTSSGIESSTLSTATNLINCTALTHTTESAIGLMWCYKTVLFMANFYCTKKCGDLEFSIDEWNKAYQFCNDAGLSESETNKILHPETDPCKTQCEACINIVLDTQIKNRKPREERAKQTVL